MNSLLSVTKPIVALACLTFGEYPFAASDALTRRPTFSSVGTVNGSVAIGALQYAASPRHSPISALRLRYGLAAFAYSTASSPVLAASSSVMEFEAAKPQAPSTRTLTP